MSFFQNIKKQLREKKCEAIFLIVYFTASLALSIYYLATAKSYEASLCILLILAIPIPYLFEYFTSYRINQVLTILLFLFCFASVCGTIIDLYAKIPGFDKILHTLSGIWVLLVGIFIGSFFIKEDSPHYLIGIMLFAFCFMITCCVIWEFIEAFFVLIAHQDHEADCIITSFPSYYLSGTRAYCEYLKDITHTEIYYNGGIDKYVIEGGYLELGLIDTLLDLFVAFVSGLFTIMIVSIIYKKKRKLPKLFIFQTNE